MNRPSPKTSFWIVTIILFVLAIALRWFRLDLMTFRYDQAAVALRCMDIFSDGLPLTGIVNSMGFKNAPGYVWMMLPAFILSPDPRIATALHGLLTATMVFPLALLGRRYRKDILAWFPAIVAAALPVAVFAGRNLWAQHLLPPLIAWVLLFVSTAIDESRDLKIRTQCLVLALLFSALATSVHFSAGLLFLIIVAILFWRFHHHFPIFSKAAVPAILVCLTMLPSILDWRDTRLNPPPKEDFVLKYESVMPAPLPWWSRLQDMAADMVSISSIDAVPGLETTAAYKILLIAYDWLLMLMTWAALACLLWKSFRSDRLSNSPLFPKVLLLMLILPVVVGSLIFPRVNPSYFLGSLPVVWLLLLFLPQGRKAIWAVICIIVLAGGVFANLHLLTVLDKTHYVNGQYYIPYDQQLETVSYLASQGVKPGQLNHVEGGWFQHSYDYIHQHVKPPVNRTSSYAVMDDIRLTDNPPRVDFFLSKNPKRFNEVVVLVFPNRGTAEIFIRRFFQIGQ